MDMELFVAQGTLLAAGPDLLDPNFMHTVVLMCQHSTEGAYGLVVNRRSEHTTATALSDHPDLGRIDLPLYVGGPVGLDTLQILHRLPERLPGGVALADGLWLGADLERLVELASADPESARASVRLFLGYSGWGAGQLEHELATGSWLPAPGNAGLVFRSDPAGLWREVVRSLGGSSAALADEPPDPSWN